MGRQNKSVILITGAAQGIGRELAIQCAKIGFELVLLDKQKQLLLSLADDLLREYGVKPNLILCDLLGATPNDYTAIASSLKQEYSKIDALILNAAHFVGLKPTIHTEIADWYNTIQVNLHANFHLIQNLLPLILATDYAEIIVPEDTRFKQEAFWGPYAVAKTGLHEFLKQVSLEYAPKISTKHIYIPSTATTLSQIAYPALNKNTLLSTEKAAKIVIRHSDILTAINVK